MINEELRISTGENCTVRPVECNGDEWLLFRFGSEPGGFFVCIQFIAYLSSHPDSYSTCRIMCPAWVRTFLFALGVLMGQNCQPVNEARTSNIMRQACWEIRYLSIDSHSEVRLSPYPSCS